MKKQIGVLVVGLMLFIVTIPLAQPIVNNPAEKNNDIDKPTWELNDQWDYLLRATLILQGGELDGNIQITINPLSVIVEERTTELYQLGYQGDVNADILLEKGILKFRGQLIDTEVAGHIIIKRENLSIQNVTLHIDGTLKLSIITVDINLDLVSSYYPSLKILDFQFFRLLQV